MKSSLWNRIVSLGLIATMLIPAGGFPTSAQAQESGYKLSLDEVASMNPEDRERLWEALRHFFREAESEKLFKYSQGPFQKLIDALLKSAQADGGLDCFFGGWPSAAKGGICDRPHRGNAEQYSKMLQLPANAGTACATDPQNHLLCNPMLFGNGVCVSISSPAEKQSAFASCESTFAQKRAADPKPNSAVSDALWSIAKEQPKLFMDLFAGVENVCTSGLQSSKPMCNKLKDRMSAIRTNSGAKPADGSPGAFTAGMAEAWGDHLEETIAYYEGNCIQNGQEINGPAVDPEGNELDCAGLKAQISDRVQGINDLNKELEKLDVPQVECDSCRAENARFPVQEGIYDEVNQVCRATPSQDQSCLKEWGCNVRRSAATVVAGSTWLWAIPPAKRMIDNVIGGKSSGCSGESDCATEFISSILSSILNLFKSAWELGKMAVKGTWNWAKSWFVDDGTSDGMHAGGNSNQADVESAAKDPQGFFSKIFSAITDWLKKDVLCAQWEGGSPNMLRSNCKQPFEGFGCMGCNEAINAVCAVGGIIAGELGTAVLTLGGANAAKHLARVGVKLGSMLTAKIATKAPTVARMMSATARGAAKTGRGVGAVARGTGSVAGAVVGAGTAAGRGGMRATRAVLKKLTLGNTRIGKWIRNNRASRIVRGTPGAIVYIPKKLGAAFGRLNVRAGELGWKSMNNLLKPRVDKFVGATDEVTAAAIGGAVVDEAAALANAAQPTLPFEGGVQGRFNFNAADDVAAPAAAPAARGPATDARQRTFDFEQPSPPAAAAPAPAPVAAPAPVPAPARLPKLRRPSPNRGRDFSKPKPIKAEVVPGNRIHYGDDASNHYRHLESKNLLPTKTIKVGSSGMKVGEVFPIGSGRYGVIFEIEHNGKKYLRAAYRSNSEASWRVMPSYVSETPMGGGWFDKSGVGEHATTLPSYAQKHLADEISAGRVRTDLSPKDGEAILTGGTRHNENFDDLQKWRESPDALEANVRNVEIAPTIDGGAPSQIKIPQSSRPDFKTPIKQYKVQSSLAGEVDAYVYRSTDGFTEYTIFKDSNNRIWFGSPTRPNSPLNAYGVHSEAADIGDLGKPLWEYKEQVPVQYRGAVNPNRAEYVDSWKFLREIPEIRRWYEATGTVMPN